MKYPITWKVVFCIAALFSGCTISSGVVLETKNRDSDLSSDSIDSQFQGATTDSVVISDDSESASDTLTSSDTRIPSDTSVSSDTRILSDTSASSDSIVPPDTSTLSDTESIGTNRLPLGIIPSAVEDWSSAYPFIDLMKQSREWYDWDFGNNEFDVDENGWVRTLEPNQTAGTVFLTNERVPIVYSRVVVTYDGQGTIEYGWDAVKVEEESVPGRDVVQINNGDHLLKITQTDPLDYLRNISIVPEGLEGSHAGGQIFNPVWLERMQLFGAIRFSKWTRINESLQENWDDRPLTSHRTWVPKGVPYSVMIALANRLQADPWFTIPHLATNDFVRQLATLVRNELERNLKVYVEHSHAPWDPRSAQYRYSVDAGTTRWGQVDDANLQWHAMKTATFCDIFKTDVFSDDSERVHCVMSLPVDSPQIADTILTCPYWVTEENDRAPCYLHGIDSIAISGFFDGCLQDDPYMDEILTWFDDDDNGMTRGMEQLADGRHLDGCEKHITALAARYEQFADLATGFGLGLLAFEGGQNISGTGTPYQEDQAFVDFHVSLNRNPLMKDRYEENFGYWKAAGGRLFIHFVEAEFPGKNGSFGALEYINQETSPKWEALIEFGESPCWWEGC